MPVVSDRSDQIGSGKKEPARVLLVEDDFSYRQTLKALVSAGRELFDTEEAENLSEVLNGLPRAG